MPVAAAVVGVVGIGMQVAGMINANNANRAAKERAKRIGEQTAGMLEEQAKQGEKVMGYQLGQFDTGAGRFLGSQSAATASSGVNMGGSSSLARSYSISNMRKDRRNLYDSYANRIKELRTKADYARENGASQADILGMQNAANMWNTGANIMNTGANIINSFYQGQ